MSPPRTKKPIRRRPAPRPSPEGSLLIRGAEVITMDADDHIGRFDVRIEGNRISAVGARLQRRRGEAVLEAKGLVLLPGFVQAHIHVCQTLFRGQADDMELLTWLRERIWPLEGAHSADTMRATARLGLTELLLGGTTAILDMGTTRHTEIIFAEAERLGMRYTGGKTIMDHGQGYPAALRESTDEAISESVRLCERWHNAAGGRLRYAFSPRFALSCTAEVMRRCVKEARARGALLHTHAAENPDEIELVRQNTGMGNVEYLHSLGFSGEDVLLAHGVWLSLKERQLLRQTRTRIVHCPSANLKLASGIARIAELLADDIHVALGADGAACNNNLDAFTEMRLAALLHKVRSGPTAVPAKRALRLATRDGALALGLHDVGSIEVGQRADVILLDLAKPHTYPPAGDLVSRIVYSARSSDVHTVLVDGRVIVRKGVLQTGDTQKFLRDAAKAARTLVQRVS